MSDILQRARHRNVPYGWPELADKMADEIERLQAALDIAGAEIDLHADKLKEAWAEIERLQRKTLGKAKS